MKYLIMVFVVFASILIANSGIARDKMIDLLVKKGIISEEELAQAEKENARKSLLKDEALAKMKCFALLDLLVEKEMLTNEESDSLRRVTSKDAFTNKMIAIGHVAKEEIEKIRFLGEERPIERLLHKKGFFSGKMIERAREKHGDAAIVALYEEIGFLQRKDLEEVKTCIELDPVVQHLIFKGVVTKEEIDKMKNEGKMNPLVAVLIEKGKISKNEAWKNLVSDEVKKVIGYSNARWTLDDLAASAKSYINISGKILWGFDIEKAVLSYLTEMGKPD